MVLELQTNETLNLPEQLLVKGIEIDGSNLVYDKLRLKINTPDVIRSLTVFNVMGQKLKEMKLTARNFVTLDVSYLSSGIYYISANNINTKPLKFIKK